MEPRFTLQQVADLLSSADGVYYDGIDAHVSIGAEIGPHFATLVVDLDRPDAPTELFDVFIVRRAT